MGPRRSRLRRGEGRREWKEEDSLTRAGDVEGKKLENLAHAGLFLQCSRGTGRREAPRCGRWELFLEVKADEEKESARPWKDSERRPLWPQQRPCLPLTLSPGFHTGREWPPPLFPTLREL